MGADQEHAALTGLVPDGLPQAGRDGRGSQRRGVATAADAEGQLVGVQRQAGHRAVEQRWIVVRRRGAEESAQVPPQAVGAQDVGRVQEQVDQVRRWLLARRPQQRPGHAEGAEQPQQRGLVPEVRERALGDGTPPPALVDRLVPQRHRVERRVLPVQPRREQQATGQRLHPVVRADVELDRHPRGAGLEP
ncbi:hypothetical protein [Micromonospora sp. NBS 11-29]|uniref:hypothetical protein n=1 Tax=Micromonospora sp. NBS 11-29 TaxID=1960879 RepID=UPI00111F9337|nr:hypothetical protein [Micromonospora sp. NBS 11-29]